MLTLFSRLRYDIGWLLTAGYFYSLGRMHPRIEDLFDDLPSVGAAVGVLVMMIIIGIMALNDKKESGQVKTLVAILLMAPLTLLIQKVIDDGLPWSDIGLLVAAFVVALVLYLMTVHDVSVRPKRQPELTSVPDDTDDSSSAASA